MTDHAFTVPCQYHISSTAVSVNWYSSTTYIKLQYQLGGTKNGTEKGCHTSPDRWKRQNKSSRDESSAYGYDVLPTKVFKEDKAEYIQALIDPEKQKKQTSLSTTWQNCIANICNRISTNSYSQRLKKWSIKRFNIIFERNNLNSMKIYPRTFRELVHSIINTDKDDFKFIGTGNPAAKILIVGQEVALDPMTSESDKFHYGLHQANNILWGKCIEKNQDFDDVPVWGRENKNYIPEDFSPLYPYKGDQKIHKSIKNGGSSQTWKRYQKLLSYVYPNLLTCGDFGAKRRLDLAAIRNNKYLCTIISRNLGSVVSVRKMIDTQKESSVKYLLHLYFVFKQCVFLHLFLLFLILI